MQGRIYQACTWGRFFSFPDKKPFLRCRLAHKPLPDTWRSWLSTHVPFYQYMNDDELSSFERNVRFFLAERDGQVVGRVCGIVNSLETAKLGRKRGRFGWFESVDDASVAGTSSTDSTR